MRVRLDQRWERKFAHARLYNGSTVDTHKPPDYMTTARLTSMRVFERLVPILGRQNPLVNSIFQWRVLWDQINA